MPSPGLGWWWKNGVGSGVEGMVVGGLNQGRTIRKVMGGWGKSQKKFM